MSDSIENNIQFFAGLTGKQIAQGYVVAGLIIPGVCEWIKEDFKNKQIAIEAFHKANIVPQPKQRD